MKRWLIYLLVGMVAISSSAQAIETQAKQAILVDTTTGTVLFSKNADEPMHPSSMSKLMTLYTVFTRMKNGRIKLDDTFAVSEKAWRTQGSKTFVPLGKTMTAEELIHGIATQSGNDACVVIAEGISGSEEVFVKEMNRIAKEIGMANSAFTNATGLPDDAHLTTARDIAILSERLIEDFPEYYPYFSLKEYTYNNITQQNRNRLLGNDIGVDGLKTGHTDSGGYGIALSAKQGDRRLVLVINGLESDNERTKEGDTLLRYGFREFVNKTLLRKGQVVESADVWYGSKDSVSLVSDKDVVVTLPAGTDRAIQMKVKYNGPLPAPIEAGAQIATLEIKMSDSDPQEIPLYAGEAVDKLSGFSRMVKNLKYYVLHK